VRSRESCTSVIMSFWPLGASVCAWERSFECLLCVCVCEREREREREREKVAVSCCVLLCVVYVCCVCVRACVSGACMVIELERVIGKRTTVSHCKHGDQIETCVQSPAMLVMPVKSGHRGVARLQHPLFQLHLSDFGLELDSTRS
jgi:hypothetical protein